MAATLTGIERYQRLAGLCERFSVDILPGKLSRQVIADRLEWIERMVAANRKLLELNVQEIKNVA